MNLQIGNRVDDPLAREEPLVAKYWSSYEGPILIYDMKVVRNIVSQFKMMEKKYNCQFLFALKACSAPEVIRFFANLDVGFDISNEAELSCIRQCLGKNRTRQLFISATGPCIHEIQDTSDINVINASSVGQLKCTQHAVSHPTCLGLRFRSDPARKYVSDSDESRFGFLENEVFPDGRSGLFDTHTFRNIECIHFHQSGGSKNVEDVEYLAKKANKISEKFAKKIKVINLGGGLFDVTIDNLKGMLSDIRTIVPGNVKLVFEFGSRWFLGAGFAIGKIIDIARARDGQEIFTLDLSMDCHLKWSRPHMIGSDCCGSRRARIYGSTCYEGDYIGNFGAQTQFREEYNPKKGNKILFSHIDIYSASWNTSFNGIPKAKVVFYDA